MHFIGYLLLLIHIFLLIWSSGGFMEMILHKVPWKPFTNPQFPTWVLIIHWGTVLFAAVCFLYGYFTHWSKTPKIMAFAYGLMFLVCVIETFGYMTNDTKYLAMSLEFLAYSVILLLFFKNKYFIEYFNQ